MPASLNSSALVNDEFYGYTFPINIMLTILSVEFIFWKSTFF